MNCNNNQNNNNGCGCNCNPHPTPAPEPVDINMSVCDRNINMLPMLQTYTTKVLKPNIDGCCKKNILKQCMMNCENYKYVIKWDFDLNGQTITVPENCILEFDGGSLKNGTIIGQDTVYINVGDVDIWGENLTREGTWREHSGGGSEQVQSDWNQTDETQPDYIKNKPSVIDVDNNSQLNFYHQFGTYFMDLQKMYCGDISLSYLQSVAMTENYVFFFFTRKIDDIDYAVCVLYDRNFNCLGYSTIDDYQCHANDATVYNGEIYLAVCMDDYHGVLKVSASTLAENCQNQNHPSTTATKILSDKHIIGIDYDPVENVFAANENGNLVLYDTSFNLVKVVKENYKSDVESIINDGITMQGLVCRDGNIECYDWYFNLEHDDWNGCGVVSIYDIASGQNKDIQYVVPNFKIEIEGVCKDPVTGVVWGVNVITDYYQSTAFSIGYYGTRRIPLDANVKNQMQPSLQGSNNGITVWVDNSEANKAYKSNGSFHTPYKSVGEALVSAMCGITRNEIVLKYTGVDYYCYRIRISDFPLKIMGWGDDKPTLITSIDVRHATVSLNKLNLKAGSNVHTNNNAIVLLKQDSYSYIDYCTITLDDIHKTGIWTQDSVKFDIGGITFRVSAEISDIDLVARTSSYRSIYRQNGSLLVEVVDNITVENNAFVVIGGTGYAVDVQCAARIEGLITLTNSLFAINNQKTGAQIRLPNVPNVATFKTYMTLASKSGNNPVFKFYVERWHADDIFFGPGEYYNKDGEIVQSFNDTNFPQIQPYSGKTIVANQDLNNIVDAGTYICPSKAVASTLQNTPYTNGNFRLWNIVNTINDNDPENVIRYGSQIINAENRLFIRGFNAYGFSYWKELTSFDTIHDNNNLLIGTTYFEIVDNSGTITHNNHKWRKVGSNAIPSVVDVAIPIYPIISKGIRFTADNQTVCKEFVSPVSKGWYSFSILVKGTGKLKMYCEMQNIGGGSTEYGETKDIDSTDWTYLSLPFYAENIKIDDTHGAKFKLIDSGDITIAAVKLEIGDAATGWIPNEMEFPKGGPTTDRPIGIPTGFNYFDTDLNKTIVWNGSLATPAWVNVDGSPLT